MLCNLYVDNCNVTEMQTTRPLVSSPGTIPKNKSDTELLSKSLESKTMYSLQLGRASSGACFQQVKDELIKLPPRFDVKNNNNAVDDKTDLNTRQDDLKTAMKWLRQEIFKLRQQDRHLSQQFALLNSTITDLKNNWSDNAHFDLGMSCQSLDFLGSSQDWSPDSDIYFTPSSSSPCTPVNELDLVNDFQNHVSDDPITRTNSVWVKRTDKEEFV